MASSREAIVEFSQDPNRIVHVGMADFPDNSHVLNFSQSDERSLMARLREREREGMSGIIHVIHRGSPTGESVYDALPAALRKSSLYHPVHIATPKDVKKLEQHPLYKHQIDHGGKGTLVVVGEDGSIDTEYRKKLHEAFANPIGIVLGGGPGSATDPVYRPLLQYLEKPLSRGVPVAGLCLGHQELGHMVALAGGMGSGLEKQLSYELGPGIEIMTERGKRQAVFTTLGDAVTVMHVNHDQINLSNKLPAGVDVLARSASGRPSALLLDFSRPNQAITFQPHAEFQMRGRGKGYSQTSEHFVLDDKAIDIPPGTHIATRMLIKKYIGDPDSFKRLARQYNLTAADVQNMLHPSRLVSHLGRRFFGPLVSWMAEFQRS